MGENRVTSVDVARAAGVSQPTVSRVFTAGARVSPELRARVEAAARKLGYRPNTLARAMIKGRSNVVGLVVAYLDNPFYAEAIELLSRALKGLGYHIIIFTASNEEDSVDLAVEDLLAHQVDGIILASVSTTLRLTQEIRGAGIPLVLFNRGQDDLSIPAVTATNYAGGRKAADLLVGLGHRRIAHISGWQKSLTGVDRMRGFLDGLAGHGLEPAACVDGRYDRETAMAATREIFGGTDRPDAVFVGNDHMAFAVMEALIHDLGLRVPADVSVVGFDDVKMAAWRMFDLTTLRQPANEMVDAVVDMLIRLIEGKSLQRTRVEIDSVLVERGTTRRRNRE
ncbi:LacI family DNA-binding transcriptional regulator [Stappia sp.]|uniref:LacI family DNA-binding transcriptional regulator n=1 Tax=Stappia sp. TaxID=1870903 RepID=UPI0032D926B9